MSEYWKHQNLDGNGLQTINQQYSRLQKNIRTAYFLCALFPLGVHQFYLKSAGRGTLFLGLSVITIILFAIPSISPIFASSLFLAEIALLGIDILKMDDQVIHFNKNLKMRLSLQTNTSPPEDFRGRYRDETPIDDYVSIKNNEITAFETKKNGAGKSRIFSFAEQEKLIKEMHQKKTEK